MSTGVILNEGPPRLHRYRNLTPWRVMPPEGAYEVGLTDRSFSNKKKAVAYQKQVKAKFPAEPCALCHTGRYYDALGRIYNTRE